VLACMCGCPEGRQEAGCIELEVDQGRPKRAGHPGGMQVFVSTETESDEPGNCAFTISSYVKLGQKTKDRIGSTVVEQGDKLNRTRKLIRGGGGKGPLSGMDCPPGSMNKRCPLPLAYGASASNAQGWCHSLLQTLPQSRNLIKS